MFSLAQIKSLILGVLGIILLSTLTVRAQTQSSKDIPTISREASRAVGLIVVSDSSSKELRQGSGVVVSSDGKVVTNYHVIDGASSGVIKFPNGAFFLIDGVLAVDKDKDIAIVKVSGSDLPFMVLADSDQVQMGEDVVSIGSPLALEASISNGIISSVRTGDNDFRVFQTTAPISAGSSGGALLNMRGEVIGITTFQMAKGQNLNFAIPINVAKPLLASPNLMKFGETPSSEKTTSSSAMRLRDVKSIVVNSFGTTEAAVLVREKLINRLAQSHKIAIVDDARAADAVLNGIVGRDVYGRADSSVFRLTNAGQILWGDESSSGGLGSASSSIANKIADRLLKAIDKDRKAK